MGNGNSALPIRRGYMFSHNNVIVHDSDEKLPAIYIFLLRYLSCNVLYCTVYTEQYLYTFTVDPVNFAVALISLYSRS